MAGYLEANPDEAECVAYWRKTGQMVPIARDGALLCLMNRRDIRKAPLVRPLPVADYVVGLELLGFNFSLVKPWDGAPECALRAEPEETMPQSWDVHAVNVMSAFGPSRGDEVVAFLKARSKTYVGPGWYAFQKPDGFLIQWAQPSQCPAMENFIDVSDGPGQPARFTLSPDLFEYACFGSAMLEKETDGRAA